MAFFYGLLFALPALPSSCFARQNRAIEVIDANFEKHSSGIMRKGAAGSTSLNVYHFKIKLLSDRKIVFDSLWVDGGACRTYVSKENSASNGSAALKKNDAIALEATKINERNSARISPPVPYKGAALLRYYVDGKPFFLTIKNIQFHESSNRP